MVKESVGPKTDLKTQGKKDSTKGDKKSSDSPDKKKAEKQQDETSTLEGQKRVTKNYRSGWKRIWGNKK